VQKTVALATVFWWIKMNNLEQIEKVKNVLIKIIKIIADPLSYGGIRCNIFVPECCNMKLSLKNVI
jgi:hypothetical protein